MTARRCSKRSTASRRPRARDDLPLRLPVQAVYRMDYRIIAGRIESGTLAVGDEIVVMPGNKMARVKSIEAWPAPAALPRYRAPEPVNRSGSRSIASCLSTAATSSSRRSTAGEAGRTLRARVFWLHPTALNSAPACWCAAERPKPWASSAPSTTQSIPPISRSSTHDTLAPNHVGDVEIALARPLAADPACDNPATGRIVIEFAGRIAGGGLVLGLNPRSSGSGGIRQLAAGLCRARPRRLARAFADLSPAERLARLRQDIGGRIVFTTSFGLEDQVITHLLCEQNIDVELITLDTGRLFNETYALWAATEQRYGRRIRALYPKPEQSRSVVASQGINGFYDSKPARLACCHVRKVEPLERALSGAQAWITGLRAEQSAFSNDMALVTADQGRGLIKVNPLFDQTREQILAFVVEQWHSDQRATWPRGLPRSVARHARAPISPGEPERAGRWWWEDESSQECGLHLKQE